MILSPRDYKIDASVCDGTELAAILNRTYDAIRSGHLNASRPPYVAAGGVWTQDAGNGDMNLMFYDGTTDHKIGEVVGGVAKFAGGEPVQPEYQAGVTYSTGDIITGDDGKLYKANKDIASSPAVLPTADFDLITDLSVATLANAANQNWGIENGSNVNGELDKVS